MSKQTTKQAQAVTVIDNESQKAITLSVDNFLIQFQGEEYSLSDIALKCQGLDEQAEKLKAAEGTVGQLMVLMAAKCGKVSTFTALCEIVEADKHWGIAPKGTPKHIKKLYHGAPVSWKTYKSRIVSAMESNIMPGSTVNLTRKLSKPNKDGQTEVTEAVKLVTPNLMDKAKRAATAPAPTVKKDGPKAGVTMDKHGQAHLHGVIGNIDPRLNGALAKVILAYNHASDAEKDKAIRTLGQLAKRLEKSHAEVQEEAKQAAAS